MKISSFLLFLITFIFSMSHVFAANLVLTEADFSQASQSEQFMVLAQLNDSGKKKLENAKGEKAFTIKVAGEEMNLKVKADLGDKIQFGPLSKSNASKIVKDINHK
jgi:hypothetical protein